MEDHKVIMSPKPQEHTQVHTTATQKANQAAFQTNKNLPNSSTPTQEVAASRAPDPTPVDSHNGCETETHDAQGGICAPDDTAGLSNHAVMVRRNPNTKVSGTAYDEAWSRLSRDERANLSNETSIKTLFEKLDETDQRHQSNSLLKRGKMAAGLQYVSNICGYINLVATWIPVPDLGAVLSLFKGIVAIAVAICGAYDGLTSHIREFLDHIPVIERCNTVLWSNSASKILVACYSTLLAFYSKVMAFLLEENRIKRILETVHSEIPGIVTDFNGHADKLSKMMEVETLVTVKKILDQQTEDFVDDNLYKQHHIGNRNADEGNRSDEACRWIISEETFEDWAYGAHGVLTMYGVVGCGKTATASFVAKYLREEGRAPVLAYYCTQQEEDELRFILCSLTYQLLQTRPELKEKFKDWSEKRQATTLDKPSNKPAVLAEFLCSSLQSSKEQVFIVLDGLDECEEDARTELLVLFRDLIRNGALVKVFVSSRQRNDILQTLASSETTEEPATEPVPQIPFFHIDMYPTEERDRILAKHLAAKPLRQIEDSKVREKAIEQLAKRAGGSAIWLKMAMASLAGAKNERRIEKCLEFLETNPELVDWYERLFKDAESATCNDRDILERALETLAVARRPLTIDELARAAYIDDAENGESLSALNEAAEEIDFLSLVRPFVTTLEESADGKNPRVRLVHQSLVELLLTARPSEWDNMAATKDRRRITEQQKEQRRLELNEQLMGRCVKYLLLDDLEDKPSDEDADTVIDTASEEPHEQDETWGVLGFDEMFVEPETQKRAETRAQISHLQFYEYAASHWASHFAACEKVAAENLRENAKALLNVAASGCTDWVSFVRTEKEAEGEVFPTSSETATLAAYFGLCETLAEALAGPDTVSQPTKNEALFWACRGGRERIVKLLLENGADANQHFADGQTALTIAAHRGYLGCVQDLLTDQRADVNVRGSSNRTALSFAAGGGHEEICAALLQREDCRPDVTDRKGKTPLFHAVAAEHLPTIRTLTANPGVNVNHLENAGRTALCQAAESGAISSLKQLLDTEGVDINLPDKEGRSPLIWAAFRGHTACVDALMQHPGIDKTAAHFKDRKNAIHFACETGMHEALLCLLKHDCPGIDDPDVDGWTPLMWAIQNSPKCVLTLLATGRVELERRDNQGKTALDLALQWGQSAEVARILLNQGAVPESTDNNEHTPLDVAIEKRTS
ncbi:hypothetical protein J7T55_010700 [Diaporthe amygdali]|uniref:uncharacterized protein n=1 Tax=Phomopsis amygdali TaxID=1214568 RepID=UPI0022FF4065|nr:uncharacterized protein J7T55_010700 [Diaporthe amygdali]KAJ0114311.1 hypothetical protein J7T55_010700 [Diaporthe amygdali]